MKLVYMECTLAYIQANNPEMLDSIFNENEFESKSIGNLRYLITK